MDEIWKEYMEKIQRKDRGAKRNSPSFNKQMEEFVNEIKKVVSNLTAWYRHSYSGLTLAKVKPFIVFMNGIKFFELVMKDKEFEEIIESLQGLAFELIANGSADHRWFRGEALYDGDYWNNFYESNKETYEHLMNYSGEKILDYLIEEYKLYPLAGELNKNENKKESQGEYEWLRRCTE